MNHPVYAVLLLILVAGLVALGVLAVVRMWSDPRGRAPVQKATPPTPLDDPAFTELRMRYARGDIDRDDYLERAAILGYPMWNVSGGPPPGPQAPPSGGV